VIHYITSDPEDEVFKLESEQFKPYYIGENRLIVLMMKLESDICVMTTPDLGNFQLKRSYVKKDIEYIYVPHDVNSANLTFHKNALDSFDTIFTSGPKNKAELAEREEKFSLPAKNLVEWGSSVIDNMAAAYKQLVEEDSPQQKSKAGAQRIILIAPSWQKDNILDSCIEQLLDGFKDEAYKIIVRPHPQYVRHFEGKIDALIRKYSKYGIEIQKDFSSNRTVYTADILITDWSSIAYEYAFSTLKPVLFINTPMKVVNPDYGELDTVPVDIELRDKVGISLEPDAELFRTAPKAACELLSDRRFSAEAMAELRSRYLYNFGKSGRVGAKYIIERLVEISDNKQENM
ncbi:MAG: CDP-glycerol glycerophosphotransferase family protein, partial [Lachnospiraceae bacterium]|nr:CDP-glycerol glycerophosphotransferase family protein [Lachnospiraceae bacterium]